MNKWVWLGFYIGLGVLLIAVSTHSCQLPDVRDPAEFFRLK